MPLWWSFHLAFPLHTTTLERRVYIYYLQKLYSFKAVKSCFHFCLSIQWSSNVIILPITEVKGYISCLVFDLWGSGNKFSWHCNWNYSFICVTHNYSVNLIPYNIFFPRLFLASLVPSRLNATLQAFGKYLLSELLNKWLMDKNAITVLKRPRKSSQSSKKLAFYITHMC